MKEETGLQLQTSVAVDGDQGAVSVTFDRALCPIDAIYGAACGFIDRFYVFLDAPTGDEVRGRLKGRSSVAIDGPASTHDELHSIASGSAYRETARWVSRLPEAKGHVDATFAITKHSVDEADELGIRSMMVEPVPPEPASGHGATREQALCPYLDLLDRMIAGAVGGKELSERFASVLLSKILQRHDPDCPGLRSPAGGGTAGLVYGHDGTVYPSEHGRRAHLDGDEVFVLGDVEHSSYVNVLRHEAIGAILVASTLEAVPGCAICAYQPYSGVLPDENQRAQGSLHGRVRDNHRSRIHGGIQDFLFRCIREGDPDVTKVFERWSAPDEHRHFVV